MAEKNESGGVSSLWILALTVAVLLAGVCGFMNSMKITEANNRIDVLEKKVKDLQKQKQGY